MRTPTRVQSLVEPTDFSTSSVQPVGVYWSDLENVFI